MFDRFSTNPPKVHLYPHADLGEPRAPESELEMLERIDLERHAATARRRERKRIVSLLSPRRLARG